LTDSSRSSILGRIVTRRTQIGVLLGGLLIAVAAAPQIQAETRSPIESLRKRLPRELGAQWVRGELLVKFREGVARREAREVHALRGARLTSRIRSSGIDVVRLPPGLTVHQAAALYRSNPLVEAAEPNLRRELLQVAPNDPIFPDQWGLLNSGQAHTLSDPAPPTSAGTPDADADVADAWATQDGDPNTVIAILDSGIDVTHPDLDANLWVNPGDATVDGVDNDLNGYVDDVNGCDLTDRICAPLTLLDPPDPALNYAHGTHVAGIAAAEYNQTPMTGVAGVCPQCRIMALKVGDAFGLNLDAELLAFDYARKMGADIVNVSFGGAIWSKLERDAIAALDAAGVLVVAAAGNAALDNDLAIESAAGGSPSFPSSYTLPNILAVAASNHHDQYGYFTGCALRAEPDCLFTHWGHDSVDVAGPGVDIVSAFPGAAYIHFNGTSMSSPFVAGVAGLVKSQNPMYSDAEIKNAIMNTVDRPAALDSLNLLGKVRGGAFTRTGDGRVNALAALGGSTANATALTDGNVDGARRMKSIKKGTLLWPDDVNDVFKRFLKRGTYRVVLDGPKGKDFDLYVWKRGTIEIWQYETACIGGPSGQCKLMRARAGPTADEEVEKLKIKKKGVYFFHVSAFLFSRGKYRLSIERLGQTGARTTFGLGSGGGGGAGGWGGGGGGGASCHASYPEFCSASRSRS
jgi:subtilisin family serine protease